MKLYVASSWRNPLQPAIVEDLRALGHEVYDFCHPPGGDHLGFSWSDVDPRWTSWTPEQYVAALGHPIAVAGFESDFEAMRWADAGVLVLKSGRSAHLEAGWFVGQGKPLWILLDPDEFGRDAGHHVTELMYRMATGIFTRVDELLEAVPPPPPKRGRRCGLPVDGWTCQRPIAHRGPCWPMYQRTSICGTWMPNARDRCARRAGHGWEHRSAYAMENARGWPAA